ncbi:hypothetical protein ABIC01_005596 [Bradyrhizobium sp. RT4b]
MASATPSMRPVLLILSVYGGVGLVFVRVVSVGYSILGTRPISEYRNATISFSSSLLSLAPSWISLIGATACHAPNLARMEVRGSQRDVPQGRRAEDIFVTDCLGDREPTLIGGPGAGLRQAFSSRPNGKYACPPALIPLWQAEHPFMAASVLHQAIGLPIRSGEIDRVRLTPLVALSRSRCGWRIASAMPVVSNVQAADLVAERVRPNKQRRMSWLDEYMQCHRCDKRRSRLDLIAQRVL